MKKMYKIRHIPTGLFYQPIKGRWGKDKTHLSKNGKTYASVRKMFDRETTTLNVSESQVKKLGLDATERRYNENVISVKLSDMEWVVYEAVETGVINLAKKK